MNSNVMLASKSHEVTINVERVNEELLTLAIYTRDLVTGRMKPVILIEGELEELDSFAERLQKAINRSR